MLGDALGPDLRRAFAWRTARSGTPHTQYWQQRNAPVEMLEGARCAETIGSSFYRAASLDRRGGNINPFAYARGLAHAAAKAGAVLHARTRVRGLARRDGRWAIDAGSAGLTADNVVIATNAYTGDLWPGLRESIIPMRGHGFVTEPLSDNVRHTILPERQSLTDTRLLYSGVRMLPDGRLHASAHGPSFGAEPRPTGAASMHASGGCFRSLAR